MTMILDRRALIKGGLTTGFLAPSGLLAALNPPTVGATGFTHDVASGDPGPNHMTLWTRYVPAGGGATRLRVQIAEKAAFTRIIAAGETVASPATDYCAKARVPGLRPGRRYYYRFVAPGGERSPIGATKTLPQGRTNAFRIAVLSCADATSGWFGAYAHAAARDDIDLVVHLGDYIYVSPTNSPDALPILAANRGVRPFGETVALADYRLRYASYRADADLAALHRAHPMISIWDDHEIADNAWTGGASGHQPNEGSWRARTAAAMRTYAEWMPMSGRPYDRYQLGDLATLFRIETRLVGRDRQLDIAAALAGQTDPRAALDAFQQNALADERRTMMGFAQEAWLYDGLQDSVTGGAHWQVLAQQVVMGPTLLPSTATQWFAPGTQVSDDDERDLAEAIERAAAGVPFGLDRWDGYPAARARLLMAALAASANLVTLSGDSHNAWAYDLVADGRAAGVEFAGPAVSSLGIERRFNGDPARIAADFVAANPDLKWCDTSRRGYMVVDLTPARASCEWVFLPSRDRRSTEVLGTHAMAVAKGSKQLETA